MNIILSNNNYYFYYYHYYYYYYYYLLLLFIYLLNYYYYYFFIIIIFFFLNYFIIIFFNYYFYCFFFLFCPIIRTSPLPRRHIPRRNPLSDHSNTSMYSFKRVSDCSLVLHNAAWLYSTNRCICILLCGLNVLVYPA